MNDNNDKIKIVIVGSSKTGKSLLEKYLKDGFIKFENYIATIGVDYGKKILFYKKNLYEIVLWDTTGKPRFFSVVKSLIIRAHILFILFNYNDRRTFDFAKNLLNERQNEQQVFVLVGAKYDLTINKDNKDNVVYEEEVLELAKEKNALCAHLSFLEKYSNGVIELLKKSLDEYIKKGQIIIFIFIYYKSYQFSLIKN